MQDLLHEHACGSIKACSEQDFSEKALVSGCAERPEQRTDTLLATCRAAIEAVLSEWFRTMGDLPIILRQAVEMGLFSSQQLVRFCRMDNRPSVARAVARTLPTSVRMRRLSVRIVLLRCTPAGLPS